VPANDERKLARALASPAHAVVADLEDAVPPAEKADARLLTARALAAPGRRPARMVRVNGAETPFFADDVDLIRSLDLDAVVLPKASPEAVAALRPEGMPVLAIVETAAGLRQAYETASDGRVEGLVLGAIDLGLDLRLEPRADGQELLYARSKLVVDSVAAELRAPFDAVHVELHDERGLEAECAFARSLGFGGKACIHPAQVEVVNRVFGARGNVAWARRVVAAYDDAVREGRGAVAVDGQMVDLPVVERARRILSEIEGSAHGD
jgi:citrate lyase beta subunit